METEKTYTDDLRLVIDFLFDPVQTVLSPICADFGEDPIRLAYAAQALLSSARDQLDQIMTHIENQFGRIEVICDTFERQTLGYRRIVGIRPEKGAGHVEN
jgi:hypothetical protein